MSQLSERPYTAKLLRLDSPVGSLTLAFLLWKFLLYFVIAFSPGPGYDTSTTLMLHDSAASTSASTTALLWPLKFARWDSVYFLHIAEKGYVFEQEWAFSYPRILNIVASAVRPSGGVDGPANLALIGVILSHATHYYSVLALYSLSTNIFGDETSTQKLICFLSAALHIISPAGAFLSAPYGEPIFSLLNFVGLDLYTLSLIAEHRRSALLRDFQVLTAAVIFALATVARSNGVLSGCLFAYDAAWLIWTTLTQGPSIYNVRRLAVILVGGCVVASGMIVPQVLAFREYCVLGSESRPWCSSLLPSIYSWVQSYYWNVGLFRYWTVSNIPLFAIAAPMLVVLAKSSIWALKAPSTLRSKRTGVRSSQASPGAMLIRLALPQGLLAVMALTSYHVQIINRIASGYPVWYWWLVSSAMPNLQDPQKGRRGLVLAAQAMVAYALIQAVLFGSFLPPA
ncbi:putative Dol-P-Man: alpha-1,6-mannosyltransferase [Penicillium oxalicum 114-2]|uniref:GPI mannosyltransferase 2 n=1 Tax=Penicillium oxalicum (strain 114-2 / CGMCC 5302) TaxID=933388 RepID=S7ZRY4_PENO1|nr:putative Dol-P-Man: alpha-1,6-mannosyltransferase [Penicillium oxalicum 114-2]